jgi:hypothetical protein
MVAGVPFIELSRLSATPRHPDAQFRPASFYGSSRLWMATAGIRVRVGPAHDRMGRYGVANR